MALYSNLILAIKAENSSKHWCYTGFVLESLRNVILASAPKSVARVWSGFKMPVGKTFQARRVGTRVTLPGVWGWTYAISGVQWCWCLGHGHEASDSCWPMGTEVYHLQMAICPLVERHFDCWCSQAQPHTQSRWHEHAANRDVFFWYQYLMNMEIL